MLQALEKLLPPRPKVELPMGDHVEEVTLSDYDGHANDGSRREAYDEDDDDDHHGPRVQCAHQ